MKIRWMMTAALLATLAGCPSEPGEVPTLDVTVDTSPDATGDGDAASETSPDVDPDIIPDVDPDIIPDVDPDIIPDVDPDIVPDVDPDIVPDVDPDITPDVDPDITPDVDPDVTPDVDLDIVPDVDPDVTPDVDLDIVPDVDPDVVPDVDPDVVPDVDPDVVPDVDPDVVPDVVPDVDPDVAPDVDPDVVPDVVPDVAPDTVPDTVPDVAPDVVPDVVPDTSAPVCGDNNLETGEACDDGNEDDGDYCSADCQTVTGSCGDDTIQANEACDGAETAGELCSDGLTAAACDSNCAFDYTACPVITAGTVCGAPLDVVDGINTFTGTFDVDPAEGFSCDETPTNVVWFVYTAPATANITIAGENATPTNAWSRLVVFDGESCNSNDAELSCVRSNSDNVAAHLSVVQGNSYLIAFLTDGEIYTMVNPTLTITTNVCGDGAATGSEACDGTDFKGALCSDGVTEMACDAACQLDISSCPVIVGAICETPEVVVNGPNALIGNFSGDLPAPGFSCDDTPTNVAWFHYTATDTATVTFTAENLPTSLFSGSRIAVFDDTCSPYEAELVCETSFSDTVSTDVEVVAGNAYQIAFFTIGEVYPLIDPTITITPHVCGDGAISGPETCDGADLDGALCSNGVTQPACDPVTCQVDISACPVLNGTICETPESAEDGLNTLIGTFGLDPVGSFSCDIAPTNVVWFAYTAAADGTITVAAQNATTTAAQTRLAVFDGAGCNPTDSELACEASSTLNASTVITVVNGNTYLIAAGTDDDANTMVNPTITITPDVCGDGAVTGGEACDGADLNGNFCSDGVTEPVCDPVTCQVDISECPVVSGTICQTPEIVTNGSNTLAGTFDIDPADGFTCDTTPTNVAWFLYTAPEDGSVTIAGHNATTTSAYSRLVVFDGDACGPTDAQLACATATTNIASTNIAITEGNRYLIAFLTDSEPFTMVNPTITITADVCGDGAASGPEVCDGADVGGATCLDPAVPAGCSSSCTLDFSVCPTYPGDACDNTADVTGGSFPVTATGFMGVDLGGSLSCAANTANTAWFEYTAPATGNFEIAVENATPTLAYSRLGVFDGAECPAGSELSCTTDLSTTATDIVPMEMGNVYTIVFGTDGNSYTMVDPSITITPVVCGDGLITGGEECDGADVTGLLCLDGTTPPVCTETCTLDFTGCPAVVDGAFCATPLDVFDGSNAFSATFDEDPTDVFTCDETPTNVVWFAYTATATGELEVEVENATTTNAYTRLVVLDGLACEPTDTELACESPSNVNVSTIVPVVSGNSYLIAAVTDGDEYTMVAPSITITPVVCGDGLRSSSEECDGTDLGGAVCNGGSDPVCTGSCSLDFTGCPAVTGDCATPADVTGGPFPFQLPGTFTADPADGFSCGAEPTNMVWFEYAAPLTGSFDITAVNDPATLAYSRLVVLDGLACGPYDAELSCEVANSATITTTASMVVGSTYLIGFFTDGDQFPMVDPELTIELN